MNHRDIQNAAGLIDDTSVTLHDVKLYIYAFMIDRRGDVRNDVTVLIDNDALSSIRHPESNDKDSTGSEGS